jgi:hypothetical protein
VQYACAWPRATADCMSDTFETRLLKAYPKAIWPTLVRGASEGVEMADAVRRSTPFLRTLVGRDQRGFLRRAAIMWRLQMLCASKELPFAATEALNTNGSSHLLSIVSDNLELHLVRTEDILSFPVDAPIRQDRRATNQPDLFEDKKIVPLTEVLRDVRRLYGWICWGATPKGELTHLCLGIPERSRDNWLAHVNILNRVRLDEGTPRLTEPPTPSAPNPALLLRFRAEIARSLEKNQEESGDGDSA